MMRITQFHLWLSVLFDTACIFQFEFFVQDQAELAHARGIDPIATDAADRAQLSRNPTTVAHFLCRAFRRFQPMQGTLNSWRL